MKSYSELKQLARKNMKGATGILIGSFILYTILIMATSWIPFAGWLLIPPLITGLYMQMLELNRGNSIGVGDLFNGFSKFVPSMLAIIIIGIISLPVSIISIFGITILVAANLNGTSLIIASLIVILSIILTIFIYILTSQTFFIIADQDLNVIESLKLSYKLAKNNVFKILFLDFSFILWYLLCVVTCGIASIWVSPYIIMTKIELYLDLKEEYEIENNIENSIY